MFLIINQLDKSFYNKCKVERKANDKLIEIPYALKEQFNFYPN